MGDKNNVIEVNGKRYDARTGKLLSSHAAATPLPVKKPTAGVSMDGFSRKRTPQPVRTVTHPTAAHAVHPKTEKSKTLMRTAVKAPVAQPVHAKSAPTPSSAPHRTAQRPGGVTPKVHTARALRAMHVDKSSLISKFGAGTKTVTHTSVLPVKPPPGESPVAAPLTHHEPNMFHRALEQATSHQQPKIKKAKVHHKVAHRLKVSPRMVNIGAAMIGVMLIGGFFAYQNVPNLALRVASARAGVNAAMPGYHPSGYSVKGAIQYSPGQIVISYGSHSDDREFKVTQRKSDWNNDALLSNFVTADKKAYQTYQDNDKTIYMYGSNSATWVENGIWYQIEGKQALSSDQLLRIAASL